MYKGVHGVYKVCSKCAYIKCVQNVDKLIWDPCSHYSMPFSMIFCKFTALLKVSFSYFVLLHRTYRAATAGKKKLKEK